MACQQAKVNLYHRSPLSKYNEPLLHFDHVNVDLVGPLPPSKDFTNLFTVVDGVTRWPEAIPLVSTNTKLHQTTAYHPQENGLMEIFHQSMKASFRVCSHSPSWISELPWVMLGLRTMPKDDLGTSQADQLFGSPFTVPGSSWVIARVNQFQNCSAASVTMQQISDLFLQYTMPLPPPHHPHLCFQLSSSSFIMTATIALTAIL